MKSKFVGTFSLLGAIIVASLTCPPRLPHS
jgi:hypothetical protein